MPILFINFKINTKQKNMKTQKIGILLLLLFSICSQGQEKTSKFYLGFKTGIKKGFGESKEESEASILAKENPTIDLGTGYSAELFVGYQFSKYIGAELGFDYFFSGEDVVIEPRDRYKMDINDYSVSVIQAKPSLVFKTNYKKFNPYLKAGLNIALDTNIENYQTSLNRNRSSQVNLYSNKDSEEFQIGYHTSIGFDYKLNKKIILFSEISLNVLKMKEMVFKAEEGTFTFEPAFNPQFDEIDNILDGNLFFANYGSKFTVSNYGLDFGIKYQL